MPIYAVRYHYTDDAALREAVRGTHRDFLSQLVDEGVVLMAGRLADDGMPGGLMIFNADSAAAVEALIQTDPFVEHGIVRDAEIREWMPVLGQLGNRY